VERIRTDVLDIGVETGGPDDGPPVFLIHGWPDAPRGWQDVARLLHQDGWHTIAPYLRCNSRSSRPWYARKNGVTQPTASAALARFRSLRG